MPSLTFDLHSIESYRMFLKVRSLPSYRIQGRQATFPDEYAHLLGIEPNTNSDSDEYVAPDWFFDYQKAITKMAIEKKRFAAFVDCGLGKTLIIFEFFRHAMKSLRKKNKKFLIISPLMVCRQMIEEYEVFYSEEKDYEALEYIPAKNLQEWLNGDTPAVAITNYDALKPNLTSTSLGGMACDESSMLKSHYGKWATKILQLGKGLEYKLCTTGTPAPNDRIEYANHAVFLDHFPTVNSFLATYFVNRGQTGERWILKDHAKEHFYRSLSHWSIFLSNPSTYGWEDNDELLPPIYTHFHDVELTEEQLNIMGAEYRETGDVKTGGITRRTQLAQLAKGVYQKERVETNKTQAILDLVRSWPEESTIIWCLYNYEQDRIGEVFPEAANIYGHTKQEERQRVLKDFITGKIKTIITKPKILGFGLNLQVATRHVFSGIQDSYEQFYQAIKRSNRVGSTQPLNVHIPLTPIEQPMYDTIARKAKMIDEDTRYQEKLFYSNWKERIDNGQA